MGNVTARQGVGASSLAADDRCPDSGPRSAERSVTVVPLSHGRRAAVTAEGGILEITGQEGTVELKVRITPEGPVLEFEEGRVALKSPGDLELDCRNLTLHSRGKMQLESESDFEHRVHGGYALHVRDDARLAAQALELVAELGELALRANDDVALNGLRVLLNVPSEQELVDRERAARSIEELLRRPFDAGGGPRRMPPSCPKKRDIR